MPIISEESLHLPKQIQPRVVQLACPGKTEACGWEITTRVGPRGPSALCPPGPRPSPARQMDRPCHGHLDAPRAIQAPDADGPRRGPAALTLRCWPRHPRSARWGEPRGPSHQTAQCHSTGMAGSGLQERPLRRPRRKPSRRFNCRSHLPDQIQGPWPGIFNCTIRLRVPFPADE